MAHKHDPMIQVMERKYIMVRWTLSGFKSLINSMATHNLAIEKAISPGMKAIKFHFDAFTTC